MTSEILYKTLFDKAKESYKNKHISVYNSYTLPQPTTDIEQILYNKKQVESDYATIKESAPQAFSFNAGGAIENYFESKLEDYALKKMYLQKQHDDKIAELNAKRDAEIEQLHQRANEKVRPISDKHAELMSYKSALKEILLKYNITPSDIKISDDITQEEFESLLDSSISVCKSLTKQRKNFSKILYWPIDTHDFQFASWYLVLIFAVFYFFAPILAILLIGYMFYSTSTIYRKIDRLRIAESMMYNLDFSKFTKENEDEVAPIDTTEIDAEFDKALKELEAEDPVKLKDAAMMEATRDLDKITQMCNSVFSEVNDYYNGVVSSYETALRELDAAINAYKESCQDFGSHINTSCVLSHEFVVGYIEDTIEMREIRELHNFVFASDNRKAMLDKLRIYLCNMILNVREQRLSVTIYDPDNLGADFADFYTNSTQEYVKIATTGYESILTKLKETVQNNIKQIGDSTIDEYNRKSEEIGKITLDYELFIVISDVKKVKGSPGFAKFMEYSARYGVMIWLCDNQSYPNTDYITADYTHKGKALEYTSELGTKVINTLSDAIKNSKVDGISYFDGFMQKVIPEEKWWTYNTIKGIELNFGYADGDPSKGYSMSLDDKNVHCLMIGGTGSGKSVALNQMLMTLCHKYSPNELELVMVDFKNVEFSTFSRQEDTGILRKIDKKTKEVLSEEILENLRNMELHKSVLPHAKVLAGTKDGEYALSIFDYLCAEMERRSDLFSKAGCKNIIEYREKYPNEVLPRILCIIDEFQVMFTEVDPKIVDVIKGRITSLSKLARFCGCHLWFTSQSMKGTLDKDILEQFTLRVALRCASTVSSDILGNIAASKIKSKVGYLYTNDSAGEDPTRNTLWRIPFADTPNIMRSLDRMQSMCRERNVVGRVADFYDQALRYSKEQLDEVYEKYSDSLSQPRLMVLGERTSYSQNKAPEHFKLTRDDGENIAAIAFEREDLLNLVMTFVDNINHKNGEALLVMHSADRESHTLLDIPSLLLPHLAAISDPNQDMFELIGALESMVANRQEQDPATLKPLYFIAVQWEKAKGISRDENSKLQDRLRALLQDGPLVDVHFIFVAKELGGLPNFVLSACNHHIAGKCGDKESAKYLDSMRAARLPQPKDGVFAIYQYGSMSSKFKIYQHKFTRELESRTVMIT